MESLSLTFGDDISVEDEEETIEEEEANEGVVDHQTELSNLAKEGRPEQLTESALLSI